MHLFKRASSKQKIDVNTAAKRRTVVLPNNHQETEKANSVSRKRRTSQFQSLPLAGIRNDGILNGKSNGVDSNHKILEEELLEPLLIEPYYRAHSSKIFDIKLPNEYLLINLTPYTFLRGKQLYPIENVQHLLSSFHMLYLHVMGEDETKKNGKIVFFGDRQLQFFIIAAFHFYAYGTNEHFIFVESPSIKRYLLFFEQTLTTHISECNMSKLESIEFSTNKFNHEKLSSLIFWLPKVANGDMHSDTRILETHLEFFFNLSQNGKDIWSGKPLKRIPQLNDTTKFILIDTANSMRWMIGDYQLDMYMKIMKSDGSLFYQRIFKYTLNTLLSLRHDIDSSISQRNKLLTNIVLTKKQLELDPGMSDLLHDDFVLTLNFVRAHSVSSSITYEELRFLQDMERLIALAPHSYSKYPSVLKQMRIGHVPKAHRTNVKLLNQEFLMTRVIPATSTSSSLFSDKSKELIRSIRKSSSASARKSGSFEEPNGLLSPKSPIKDFTINAEDQQAVSKQLALEEKPTLPPPSCIPPPPITGQIPPVSLPPGVPPPPFGAPPPPPLPPLNLGNLNNAMNNIFTKKLKKIHWRVVKPNSDSSFWNQRKDEIASLSIDVDRIEKLFDNSGNLPPKVPKTGMLSPKSPAVGSINLLGATRLQNVEIMLKQFHHFERLEESLLNILSNLESEMLTDAQLIALKKIIPTDEEKKSLLEYNGDIAKLNFANRFMRSICSSFRWQAKVDTLIYMREFNASIARMKQYLNSKIQAYRQLRTSTHLSKLLELALVVGNTLNRDNPRLANAPGFSVLDLVKLSQIKAVDKKTTPLHYIIEQLRQNGNTIVDFNNELSSIRPASEIEQSIIQVLSDEIGSMALHFQNECKNAQFENDVYQSKVLAFTAYTETEISKLKELTSLRLSEYNQLMLYFCESNSTSDANLIDDVPFLSNMVEFQTVYEKYWKENEKEMDKRDKHEKISIKSSDH